MTYEVSITEFIGYTDLLIPSINIGTFSDSLILREAITNNIVTGVLVDSLHYVEETIPGPNTFDCIWADELSFTETITPKDRIGKVNEFLFMWDVISIIDDNKFADTISYSEIISATSAMGLYDTLEYVETWSFDITKSIHMFETLVMSDKVHGYFADKWRSHYPVLE